MLRVNNSWLKVFPMMGRDNDLAIRNKGNRGRISSVLSSVICVLRGLPLFFARRPKTPNTPKDNSRDVSNHEVIQESISPETPPMRMLIRL